MNALKRLLVFSAVAGLLTVFAPAQKTNAPSNSGLMLGVAWYPEQWPEDRWEKDLVLMQAAGIHVVRIGEFAWSTMEPSEGKYELDWLQRATRLAAKHHIDVILGTPTAAPPVWLTQKYPDTLLIDEQGKRAVHGNRAHFSFTSPRYREFCRKIAEEMARKLAKEPNVIGWQLDNEVSNPSYDGYTRAQFQEWLKDKYKGLDALNQHWTTAYWSQTYFDWSQIPIPVGGNNPGLMLDWKRFITDTWYSYLSNQIAAIRKYAPASQPICTNTMGLFDGFDHYKVESELDIVAWDHYVGQGHLNPDFAGFIHDLNRGLKQKNFWVIETQPGAVNWQSINNVLDKGEVRAMAWHDVAHGADMVSYWQWRSALNGQEEYHGVLVGADGTPVPVYDEVKQVGNDFAKAYPVLAGTSPHSEVAMLHDYDSRWAIDWQKHNRNYDQIKIHVSYYHALRKLVHSIDVVNPSVALKNYKVVVAPNLSLIPDSLAKHLREYVEQGGHLVLGPRAGMKDEFNALLTERQPGALVDTLGGRVEQFYALDQDVPLEGPLGSGHSSLWAEQLSAKPGTDALLTFGKSNGWLDRQPAIISRKVGKGRITYVGAVLDESLMDKFAGWIFSTSGLHSAFGLIPDGVDVSERSGNGKDVFVLINFKQENQSVQLPKSMKRVLANGESVSSVNLPPYGVEVLEAQ
ncbi:Beta-galactosidase [Candidatus Koribacter versatilis Ellin345]|uniref:Beta-galactosidase n=1 Tax=Koribacter versatilis (strain Ellin345) TaxID=204669 RepID=Q1IT96_KORVE|nr:beta-galactosidase [Candidatus Koribacter versatilis]ABF39904.1 Beta-galactosidase [Candidatus Koribacter versatilis Ellin345]